MFWFCWTMLAKALDGASAGNLAYVLFDVQMPVFVPGEVNLSATKQS
jgi:hypothetical protein